MTVSRRRFFGTSAALPTTAAAATLAPEQAQVAAQSSAATPPAEVIALHRLAYGPRPGDIERVRAMGLSAYVDEQLNPGALDDSACEARIKSVKLKIKYAGSNGTRHEVLPLTLLDQPLAQLWTERIVPQNKDYQERRRPADEVRVATYVRAVLSKCQLRELLVDFWHNHFNVEAFGESAISVAFPNHDKSIRQNCLGNFRTLLEAIAKSTAMLYYLDNRSNKDGGGESGNENYTRELFELHTLGTSNYLSFTDTQQGVGTITYNNQTYARGYTEDDVFEACRCLTGWTVADAQGGFPKNLPNNGEFFYFDNWHDTGKKIVLSLDGRPTIKRNQPPLKDAQDLFAMLAGHPGTARSVCTKLVRRFVADAPPQAVVDAAVATWMANVSAPDQLKQVLRTILLSNEFKTTWGQKVKRPVEAVIAYLRATNAALPDDYVDSGDANKGNCWGSIFYNVANTGHNLFGWPTPNGHPDVAGYWLTTNGMLRRWNLPYVLTQDWGGNIKIDLVGQTNMSQSCTQIVDFWIGRLCGFSIDPAQRQELINFMAQGGDASKPPKPTAQAPDWNDAKAIPERLSTMVQLLAMYPDFHTR